MIKDISEPSFDFKQISKEVFEKELERWENLKSEEAPFDLDGAWQIFLEEVRASKNNYIFNLESEAAQIFDQAYQDYFYEGGHEAYQCFLKGDTTLRYQASAIEDFVALYEAHFSSEKKAIQEKETDTKLKKFIQTKDYKGLAAHLKEGIQEYLKSDTFKNYLRFLSQFHQYSEKNIRLLLAQNPDVRHVASFKQWKSLENPVKKGEKALYVYAPRKKVEKDAEGKVVKDEDGNPKTITYFVLVPVFDVSQTMMPEKMPKPVYALPENVDHPQHFYELYKGLCAIAPVPVVLEEMEGETYGYYSPSEKKIVLRSHQGEEMTLKTLIHEITHATLHINSSARFGDETYSRQEFEAEAVAYVVTHHLGIDSSAYSFGYLSSWTDGGQKFEDFQHSLATITQQAEGLIQKLEETLNKGYGLVVPQNEFEKRLKEVKISQVERPVSERKTTKKGKEEAPEETQKSTAVQALMHRVAGQNKTLFHMKQGTQKGEKNETNG